MTNTYVKTASSGTTKGDPSVNQDCYNAVKIRQIGDLLVATLCEGCSTASYHPLTAKALKQDDQGLLVVDPYYLGGCI